MDYNDWDLSAVVRGCSGASATIRPAADNPFSFPGHEPFQISRELSSLEINNTSFQGLYDIYQDFCVDPPPPVQHVLQTPTTANGLKSLLDSSSTKKHKRLKAQSKRRKNEGATMVHEMTEEEVGADKWAWRKYGQKPIKGSLYPRNYYRCATSKSCAAKRQVERSPINPLIFLVSYTGEHTHERPPYLKSLSSGRGGGIKSSPEKDSRRDFGCGKGLCVPSLLPMSLSSISPMEMAEKKSIDGGVMVEENVS